MVAEKQGITDREWDFEVFNLGFSCSIAFLDYLASALLMVEYANVERPGQTCGLSAPY